MLLIIYAIIGFVSIFLMVWDALDNNMLMSDSKWVRLIAIDMVFGMVFVVFSQMPLFMEPKNTKTMQFVKVEDVSSGKIAVQTTEGIFKYDLEDTNFEPADSNYIEVTEYGYKNKLAECLLDSKCGLKPNLVVKTKVTIYQEPEPK